MVTFPVVSDWLVDGWMDWVAFQFQIVGVSFFGVSFFVALHFLALHFGGFTSCAFHLGFLQRFFVRFSIYFFYVNVVVCSLGQATLPFS